MMKLIQIFILTFFIFIEVSFAQNTVIISGTGALPSEVSMAVLKEAYKNIGYEMKVKIYPVKRSMLSAAQGNVDGLVASERASDGQDFSNLIIIPVEIFVIDMVMVSKNAIFDVQGFDSLKPYTVGIVRGYKSIELLDGLKIEEVNSDVLNLKKVAAGRIDLALAERIEAMVQIKTNHIEGLTILEPSLFSIGLFHYVHKNKQNLIEPLTRTLNEMKQSGRMDQIWKTKIEEIVQR